MLDLLKHSDHDTPILTATAMLAYRRRTSRAPQSHLPQAVIICHPREPLTGLLKHYRAAKVAGFFGELRVLTTRRHAIGVLHPVGPGAPIMAMVAEELIAFGVRRLISIGWAGSLQLDLQSGDVVSCDRALRDEGTSYHYLPPDRAVDADPALTQQVSAALAAHGIAHSIGTSWTTDAPYRETRREVEAYRAAGVKTVEMEAAALFAVGQCFSAATAAVFVVGDRLADLTWQAPLDARLLRQQLAAVTETIIDSLDAE